MGKKVFEIVSAARRPLTLEELREATSIEPGNPIWDTARIVNDVTKLLGCCGSLVTVDEESSTVQLAHSSVKQHLETIPIGDDISEYHIATEKANLLMGEIVVTYLNLDVLQNILTNTSSSSQTLTLPEMTVLLKASLPPHKLATTLARKLLKNRKTPGYDVGRDLERVAGFKREQQTQSLEIHSLLSYAQKHWFSHTKSFHDASMYLISSTSYDLWTQLIEGRVPIVDLPWTSEDALALNPSFLGQVPQSHHPALIDYACLNLVKRKKTFLEIQHFVDLLPPYKPVYEEHAPGSYYDVLLFQAVLQNNEDLVQLLLDKTPAAPGSYYDVVLFQAVLQNNKDLVQLLLDKTPADVNSHVIGYSSILNEALRSRNLGIVKTLIHHGADVNAKEGGMYISPLECAARSSSGLVAILLLVESGADQIPILDSYSDETKRVLQTSYDETYDVAKRRAARLDRLKRALMSYQESQDPVHP